MTVSIDWGGVLFVGVLIRRIFGNSQIGAERTEHVAG